jgi:hypothetical protein
MLTSSRRVAATAVLTVATGLTLVGAAGSAPAATHRQAAPARVASKPGLAGSVIALTHGASFDGDPIAYRIASDHSGTAYLAWISSKDSVSGRQIHLCTLPLGAKACKGGAQAIDIPNSQDSGGIQMVVAANGLVTVLWYVGVASGGGVYDATSTKGGPLTAPQLIIPNAQSGVFLDAGAGPNGQIWTVLQPNYENDSLQVRSSLSGSPVSVRAPFNPGSAKLAFYGSTPVLAVTENASLSTPVEYSYRPGTSWHSFKKVSGTYVDGHDIGLTTTSSGMRLTTGSPVDYGATVVSKWTGHSFTKAVETGDKSDCVAESHYTVTDASGRLVDVSNECDKITVADLPGTTHASILRFGAGGTEGGGEPAITSTPRGHAWVVWSIESGGGSGGETLKVAPFLLPGLPVHKRGHASHGTVTVTGPVSCQPADVIGVGVSGHADKGWSVSKKSLKLGHKTVHGIINGAQLSAGKRYTLVGTVVFKKGHSASTGKAKLTFRSCPKP